MTGGLAVLTAFAILKGNLGDIPTTIGNLNVGFSGTANFLLYVLYRLWRLRHKRLL